MGKIWQPMALIFWVVGVSWRGQPAGQRFLALPEKAPATRAGDGAPDHRAPDHI